MLYSLSYPPLSSISHLEGTGNFAVLKYYTWPYRLFYRHKLKMIIDLMKDDTYGRILDFGSGSGIFTTELKKHASIVYCVDKESTIPSTKFDAIVCASVLEFCHLYSVVSNLNDLLNDGGVLYVASPMDTRLSQLYFKLINDRKFRHGHELIMRIIQTKFCIKEYKEWMGLYFALRAVKL